MHQLVKVGFGFSALAGAGGGTYGVYKIIRSSSSYSRLLSDTLLNTKDNTHETNWGKRLATLKAVNDDTLVNSLQLVKNKKDSTVTWTDLRDWCGNIINSPNNWGKELLNVQTYCTFSIKEKIDNAIDESQDTNWDKAFENLKKISSDTELDQELITAKGKNVNNVGKVEVRAWCTKVYNSPYRGQNNKDFKNALRICVASS